MDSEQPLDRPLASEPVAESSEDLSVDDFLDSSDGPWLFRSPERAAFEGVEPAGPESGTGAL